MEKANGSDTQQWGESYGDTVSHVTVTEYIAAALQESSTTQSQNEAVGTDGDGSSESVSLSDGTFRGHQQWDLVVSDIDLTHLQDEGVTSCIKSTDHWRSCEEWCNRLSRVVKGDGVAVLVSWCLNSILVVRGL